MLTLYPNIRKVLYLDIPPAIFIATEYLRSFYGDAVEDYAVNREREMITFKDDNSLEIICICPWQIDHTDCTIDLFWNACSFSKMTPDIVENYAVHVERLLNDENGAICLLLNQEYEFDEARTSQPSQILGLFKKFDFQEIVPEIEHPEHYRYIFGKR